ncbi:TPA: hypothetical protein DEP34_05150 [Candidatus Uhrbacteria bacterium]|uniref:Uncharacterized protein n=2 Tax=Candidatus Uhriibacteriota TaxID=1752732 RepID=A0A0G1T4E6_9BACT|nr:MAG: hypothetical protein UX45_C0029G0008 [Candidatus Uhrbacteria bacterium GW2011_GWF2_46_218]KKU40300.1 MAG: hypothetical protein UX57_C0020G0008 [Candidatus Uhrbacteria bacterium GW2011_GWE2_46_68]HBK33433.1 hypothetical protein [Candidatus Uhrbacteria bacterium]HCB19726.1 hypothetical protein [Candidatus Uhrbacteria bacterium]
MSEQRGYIPPDAVIQPAPDQPEMTVALGESAFHEAFSSSVSSVRDSLPEQHRAHFETLRQEMIDFAQTHGIPREALSKSDTLLEAAKKLNTPDSERLTTLFERFKYLVKHKEPKEITDPLEYVEVFYHLHEQYDFQVYLLEQAGILKEGAILGIDGKTYPIPTLEQIAMRLFERRETLRTKHDQGFTKLLLVPFGMSLDILQETFKQFLLDYKQSHPFFDLDTNQPLWAWEEYRGADIGDSPRLVYEVGSFEDKNHGGKTKMEILEEEKNTLGRVHGDRERKAWTVLLLQPSNLDEQDTETPTGIASIPREGQGTSQGDIVPRPPLEANKIPNEYLFILQKAEEDENSPYHNESGLTPEDWIMAFMLHLKETGKPLDDVLNPTNTESYCHLTGAYSQYFINVPISGWNKGRREVIFSRTDPRTHYPDTGLRSGIVV